MPHPTPQSPSTIDTNPPGSIPSNPTTNPTNPTSSPDSTTPRTDSDGHPLVDPLPREDEQRQDTPPIRRLG